MKMLLELCLLSTIILLTNAHTSGSTCVPIPELSSRPSWISWCQTNCKTAAGTHPACDGDGVHVKCKCGEDSCKIYIKSMILKIRTTLLIILKEIIHLHFYVMTQPIR